MILRRLIRFFRDRRGQSLIETALSIGIILVVMIGILELSIALYDYNYVAYAARAGTRWAMVRGSKCTMLTDCNATPSQIQAYVQGLDYPLITPSKLTVSTTWLTENAGSPTTWSTCTTSPCNTPGNEVQLTVNYPFTMHIPILDSISLNLHSTSSMVISQ